MKTCITCKHCRFDPGMFILRSPQYYCLHPETVHRVTGMPFSCDQVRAYEYHESLAKHQCGPRGYYWEKKDG